MLVVLQYMYFIYVKFCKDLKRGLRLVKQSKCNNHNNHFQNYSEESRIDHVRSTDMYKICKVEDWSIRCRIKLKEHFSRLVGTCGEQQNMDWKKP